MILALAATGVTARSSSSSAMASMAVVNGPIRHEIGMNAGTGAMGPYSHANATIGRAYGLLSQNGQGGSVPGLSYMGNQGNSYAYNSVTFAENEERSPWEPFHVQGELLLPPRSAVSAFSGLASVYRKRPTKNRTMPGTCRAARNAAGNPIGLDLPKGLVSLTQKNIGIAKTTNAAARSTNTVS